jgi:hypothetical protein
MTLPIALGLAIILPVTPVPTDRAVRAAITKALPPLAAAATGHVEQKTCFACHNQTYPLIAFREAGRRGFTVPPTLFADQTEHVTEFLDNNLDAYRSGKGTGGQVDTAGAALFALEMAGVKPGEATDAVVEYLLKTQPGQGHWRSTSNRPPTEASHFTATAFAVRGLSTWARGEARGRAKGRTDAARTWLAKTKPTDTEDRVFRLLGLSDAKAEPATIAAAAFDLILTQRPDGGWGQLDSLVSDPYATATALVVLSWSRELKPDHPSYRAGVRFLVGSQRADGTWRVRSRSKPFQPYYESGFPHGTNQFLSATASGWATAALALTIPASP